LLFASDEVQVKPHEVRYCRKKVCWMLSWLNNRFETWSRQCCNCINAETGLVPPGKKAQQSSIQPGRLSGLISVSNMSKKWKRWSRCMLVCKRCARRLKGWDCSRMTC
jgi:hypothetical protein